jgi:hypothetical protein
MGVMTVMTAPTLPAVTSPDGVNAYVWCRYCDRFHTHGNLAGHRLAHCIVEDSPYRGGGYVLEMVEGTKRSLQPPASERRKPRRRSRFLGYVLVHGWNEERSAPAITSVTPCDNCGRLLRGGRWPCLSCSGGAA